MKAVVVWLDRENAKIFEFSSEKMERKQLHATHTDHHTHQTDAFDIQNREKRFFREVASIVGDAEQLLIFGPGITKHHFRTFLMEQVPQLARRVTALESVDHPTDAQIAAKARQLFKPF